MGVGTGEGAGRLATPMWAAGRGWGRRADLLSAAEAPPAVTPPASGGLCRPCAVAAAAAACVGPRTRTFFFPLPWLRLAARCTRGWLGPRGRAGGAALTVGGRFFPQFLFFFFLCVFPRCLRVVVGHVSGSLGEGLP